jgi:hypothetical protein
MPTPQQIAQAMLTDYLRDMTPTQVHRRLLALQAEINPEVTAAVRALLPIDRPIPTTTSEA